MISIKGYIHGNTVIAQDESLRQFDGKQILVQIPDVAEKNCDKSKNEMLMEQIANLFENRNCWNTEEDMLLEMAMFRRSHMGQ